MYVCMYLSSVSNISFVRNGGIFYKEKELIENTIQAQNGSLTGMFVYVRIMSTHFKVGMHAGLLSYAI